MNKITVTLPTGTDSPFARAQKYNAAVTAIVGGLNTLIGAVAGAQVPPVAAFTVGEPTSNSITVDGHTSTGANLTYGWNFGDGTTATGVTASHTYAAAGTYQVTLTVVDSTGANSTLAKTVAVTLPAGGGSTFTYGTTKPTSANTGVGNVTGNPAPTVAYTGPTTITSTQTISDRIINSPITASGTGVVLTLRNCILQAAGTDRLIHLYGAATGGPRVIAVGCDFRGTDLTATNAQVVDGVGTGGGTTSTPAIVLDRCHLYHLNDGIDPAYPLQAKGCLIDQFETVIDTSRVDGRNHNDGVQVAGGTGFDLWGCTINGTSDASRSDSSIASYLFSESAVMLTPLSAYGPITGMQIRDNWLDGGLITINGLAWTASCTGSITGNRFGRNTYFSNATASAQFKTGATSGLTWSGNVHEDDGSTVSIHFA